MTKQSLSLINTHNAEEVMFSVIMPCYNSEEYVENAIESIITQDYSNWELIAINDGSTDNTLSILNKYALHDHRIKVFSKQNGGYASAVNMGIDKNNGDYLLMLGSDDTLGKNLFSNLYSCFKEGYPDCICWRTICVKNGNKTEHDSYSNFADYACEYNTSFAQYTNKYPAHSAIFSMRDTSKCYKTSIVGDIRYFGKYGLDSDGIFSMLVCHRAKSFASVPVDGYFWTLRNNSVSAKKNTEEQLIERTQNWMKFYEIILESEFEDITEQEKGYIDKFWSLIDIVWVSSRPFFKNYRFVKQALKLLKKISNKTNYKFSPAIVIGFSIYFPVLWKICCILKLRDLVHKIIK